MKDQCQKVKYSDEENAWYSLHKINSIQQTQLNNVYFCKECNSWHLTRQKPSKDKLEKQIEHLSNQLKINKEKRNRQKEVIFTLQQKSNNQKTVITSLIKQVDELKKKVKYQIVNERYQ